MYASWNYPTLSNVCYRQLYLLDIWIIYNNVNLLRVKFHEWLVIFGA